MTPEKGGPLAKNFIYVMDGKNLEADSAHAVIKQWHDNHSSTTGPAYKKQEFVGKMKRVKNTKYIYTVRND